MSPSDLEGGSAWRYFIRLVTRVDYRHEITNRHITSTYRADGVGLYGDASRSRTDGRLTEIY